MLNVVLPVPPRCTQIALVGAAGLVLVGLYLFLFPKKGES